MSEQCGSGPTDLAARQKAVDVSLSCIVQAPAGSGKTELLVQRILALLATANVPEEVLSITFTRKAAGEMRLRLLQALERARIDQPPGDAHEVETWRRARNVLERDRRQGWNLLDNPSRLQLTTIDSFCAFLTRRMPWLARFGEQPGVTDDPQELYRMATEQMLGHLESGGAGQESIEYLLAHLDNRMTLLRDLVVDMLGRRDQWLRHLLPRRKESPRQVLEDGLSLYVAGFLQRAYESLGERVFGELCELAAYAAGNLESQGINTPMRAFLDEQRDPTSCRQWQALAHLVLTAAGTVRKTVNKSSGFPADKAPQAMAMKARAQDLLAELRVNTDAEEALQGIRKLPAEHYGDEQWQVLEALIALLPLAVIELQEVFRQRGLVDFIEIAGAAQSALGSTSEPEELLLQLDSKIQHILVDEFQDTSFAQYDLLRCLTAGWTPGDGRTLFVVGDPMQSIYRFREAEVGLYLRVCERGLDSLPMERIVLCTNFRSSRTIVDWTNRTFEQLFPAEADELSGAVPFSPAMAFLQGDEGSFVSWHGFSGRQDRQEADAVVSLIQKTHRENSKGTVAVLVRSRAHLAEIAVALRRAGLRYQAQEIDPLVDRPVVRDIVSLARALSRPADRIAWLALLRAPWCGLSLGDLTRLCGNDAKSTIWALLTRPAPQQEMFDALSADARQRLDRILPVLERALNNRGRFTLRQLVESTWLSLNGPSCLSAEELQDAVQAFTCLDALDREKGLEDLEEKLSKLFAAADPQAGPEIQLMTIHKAKGLEFDTVVLPGLGRGVRGQERALLRWLEHPDYELLLAPIPPLLSDQQEPTYKAIGHILQEKDRLEIVRLLYVASTRAKSRLHLLGHARDNGEGEFTPLAGSLLSVLWPTCEAAFAESVMEAPAPAAAEQARQKIRRLPADWSPPEMPCKLVVPTAVVRKASYSGGFHDENVRTRRTEEGRVVGTIIHEYLERFSLEGVVKWTPDTLQAEQQRIKSQLSMYGVPSSRLEFCAAKVAICLKAVLQSKRGQWLLGQHREAASELPVNGLVDGQLVRATIDRTFVDTDGTRWVVDYKTSAPERDAEAQLFMADEMTRYQEQLLLYGKLLRAAGEQGDLRMALYFPVFDGWIESGDTS